MEAYRESVYVGYRYYLSAGKRVRYPFGFGLSYTEFTYSDLKLDTQDGEYTAGLNVSNTGRFDGAEVVQLYVSAPESGVFKPLRELRGFSKVFVAAGRTEHVTVRFSQDDLRYYHPGLKKWVLEPGTYRIQIGAKLRGYPAGDRIKDYRRNGSFPLFRSRAGRIRQCRPGLRRSPTMFSPR